MDDSLRTHLGLLTLSLLPLIRRQEIDQFVSHYTTRFEILNDQFSLNIHRPRQIIYEMICDENIWNKASKKARCIKQRCAQLGVQCVSYIDDDYPSILRSLCISPWFWLVCLPLMLTPRFILQPLSRIFSKIKS